MLNDEFLSNKMSDIVRKNKKNKKEGEKLFELINRIERETDDYVSFNEIE